jgi:hypothetical protein
MMIGSLLRFLSGQWPTIAFGLAALCMLLMAAGVITSRFKKAIPVFFVSAMCLFAWGWHSLPKPPLPSRPSTLSSKPPKPPKVELAKLTPPKLESLNIDLPKIEPPTLGLPDLLRWLPEWSRIGRSVLATLREALPDFSGLDFQSAANRQREQELIRQRKQQEVRELALARKQYLRAKNAAAAAAIDNYIAVGTAQAVAEYENGLAWQRAQAQAAMTPRPGVPINAPSFGTGRPSVVTGRPTGQRRSR